jgi:putative hydrolase of the HAD superfamily
MHPPSRSLVPGSIALVIFDLDGVLLDFHPERRLAHLATLSGLEPGAIHDAIWGSSFEREAEAGAYPTGADYLAEFNRRIGFAFTREQWIAARGAAMTVRPEMGDLVHTLRHEVRLAILTNNGALLGESLPVLVPELCDVFLGACHATCEFGTRKPDPLVYRRLLERHGVPAEAALFVDDDLRNVEGALAAGMHGIHFQGIAPLKAALASLLPGPG